MGTYFVYMRILACIFLCECVHVIAMCIFFRASYTILTCVYVHVVYKCLSECIFFVHVFACVRTYFCVRTYACVSVCNCGVHMLV